MIQAQQAATRRSLEPDPRLIYWPWGFAWLIGFGLLFLRHGPQEQFAGTCRPGCRWPRCSP